MRVCTTEDKTAIVVASYGSVSRNPVRFIVLDIAITILPDSLLIVLLSTPFRSLFLAMLSLCCGCYGFILRTPCKVEADFSVFENGKVLTGAFLANLTNKSEIECEMACVDNLECKSINYNAAELLCQLSNKVNGETGTSITSAGGWKYKSTNYQTTLVRYL